MEICGGQTHSFSKNGLLRTASRQSENDSWSWLPSLCYPISLIDKAVSFNGKKAQFCVLWRYGESSG